ncbi:hypothetical protein ONE63_006662 [Megalurothrips usitatus]|uniref:Uncharacterized protein n=1 Tax=Megalurothrips usitatus TaxID=439358 RepID=A0AAV7XUQ4_9NEOP|nr:hypothetical protein ONE63_006662 [Megalurothrips usitatus]
MRPFVVSRRTQGGRQNNPRPRHLRPHSVPGQHLNVDCQQEELPAAVRRQRPGQVPHPGGGALLQQQERQDVPHPGRFHVLEQGRPGGVRLLDQGALQVPGRQELRLRRGRDPAGHAAQDRQQDRQAREPRQGQDRHQARQVSHHPRLGLHRPGARQPPSGQAPPGDNLHHQELRVPGRLHVGLQHHHHHQQDVLRHGPERRREELVPGRLRRPRHRRQDPAADGHRLVGRGLRADGLARRVHGRGQRGDPQLHQPGHQGLGVRTPSLHLSETISPGPRSAGKMHQDGEKTYSNTLPPKYGFVSFGLNYHFQDDNIFFSFF